MHVEALESTRSTAAESSLRSKNKHFSSTTGPRPSLRQTPRHYRRWHRDRLSVEILSSIPMYHLDFLLDTR